MNRAVKNKGIYKQLLIFLFIVYSLECSAVVVDVFGTGQHLWHKVFVGDSDQAQSSCEGFAASIGHDVSCGGSCDSNGNPTTLCSAGGGWWRDESFTEYALFHQVNYYYPRFYLPDEAPNTGCEKAGNPIDLLTGRKTETKSDLIVSGIEFKRYYSSGGVAKGYAVGVNWRHSFDTQINDIQPQLIADVLYETAPEITAIDNLKSSQEAACQFWEQKKLTHLGGALQHTTSHYNADKVCEILEGNEVIAQYTIRPAPSYFVYDNSLDNPTSDKTIARPNGHYYTFRHNGSAFYEMNGMPATLEKINNLWVFTDSKGNIDSFENGLLKSRRLSSGALIDIHRDDIDRISTIQRGSSVLMTFQYDDKHRIKQIDYGTNQSIEYSYEANNLKKVTYDNGDEIIYHYEDIHHPNALTGYTDELGERFATWQYDAEGRAIRSFHGVDKEDTLVNYQHLSDVNDPRVIVTNAHGKDTIYHYEIVNGFHKITEIEGVASTHCAAANQYKTYDRQGRLLARTDWNDNVSYFEYDERGRKVLEIKGYRWINNSPKKGIVEDVINFLTLPPPPQTIREKKTCWHPTFNKPERIIENDRVTLHDYFAHGQLKSTKVAKRTASNENCQ